LRITIIAALALFVAVGFRFTGFTDGPATAAEQDEIVAACQAPEHRQFDFWLGDWQVTDTAGQVVGTNQITRVASGCGVLENWRSANNGNEGTSLNGYDPRAGVWRQTWYGFGLHLDLEGGIEDGRMVLSGERQTQQGKVVDRISWTPLDDGRVHQVWEASQDDGKTWGVLFDGMYAPR
jgi:hypothetical protein